MRALFYWIMADFFVPADNVRVGWGKTGVKEINWSQKLLWAKRIVDNGRL